MRETVRQGSKVSAALKLETLIRLPITGRGPGYTCGVLAQEMSRHGLDVEIVTPRARNVSLSPARLIQALPFWARPIPYRLTPSATSFAVKQTERLFVDRVLSKAASDRVAAYIFPEASIEVLERLHDKGVPIFREMINCHRGTAKRILDDAYERVGRAPAHGITAESVLIENEALELADFIFCPNSLVEDSLTEHHGDPGKIIHTSYGWDPARFAEERRRLKPADGLTVLFAGGVSIRKGAHLLLDYWARSGVVGRLVLVGKVEPTIRELCGDLLSRPDVLLLDYTRNIGDLYRSADVFAFPTLEEGGPQVTYEACGCGLPVLTSPMGAGRAVRNGVEGFVLDPYDGDAWVTALRDLAADKDKRVAMAAAAAARAKEFVWSKVAGERNRQIELRLGEGKHDERLPSELLV
ncbi:MAG TPA: glycosyltransferase family 4 protein [Caulobacteraceae bacterium]|jgi:glycosyltransferase involved in cell wall biosynthesis